MIVLGVDAGGTKTQAYIADEEGNILGEGLSGPGNHQTVGIKKASSSIASAIKKAAKKARVPLDSVSYSVLGISGADRKQDFDILIPAVGGILKTVPFTVINDSWLGLRLASAHLTGVVSICGTGSAHAGRNADGRELIVRNLDYTTGNTGGGAELADRALHYAFRSEEGTWEKSLLEEAIPEIFEVKDMEEVCDIVFNGNKPNDKSYRIPIKVFELARKEDPVCVRLIQDMGHEMGHYAAGVLKRLDMCDADVPASLIGSLFYTNEPLLIDSYMETVNKTAPLVYPVIPSDPPVLGAVKLAIDKVT